MAKAKKSLTSILRIRRRAAGGILALSVVLLPAVIATPLGQAQTFNVLYNFPGSSDGGNPYAGVVRDATGNLYGTAFGGGSFNLGVVFKVDKNGTETVLHNFTGGADGGYPFAGLVRDTAGNLYGTTYYGGSFSGGTVGIPGCRLPGCLSSSNQ
jgi:uncharacterized repeat protein (TIGR03803 family)